MNVAKNDMHLAYDDLGTGFPVMLIHGFPLCRRMWRPQAEALVAAGFRVILPDLRGFGDSEAGSVPGSVDLLADDLVALLDRLGIERALVGGMSMGGYVLLNLLTRYRTRLAGACFIVTRADADDETARAKRQHLIAEIEHGNPGAVPTVFTPLLFAEGTTARRPELVAEVRSWIEATSPTGMVLGLQAIRDRGDSQSLLSELKLPTLVIGAREDRAIPPEKSTALAEGVPNAELCMIGGAGHMVNLEQTEAFNAALLGFARKLEPAWRADQDGPATPHGNS